MNDDELVQAFGSFNNFQMAIVYLISEGVFPEDDLSYRIKCLELVNKDKAIIWTLGFTIWDSIKKESYLNNEEKINDLVMALFALKEDRFHYVCFFSIWFNRVISPLIKTHLNVLLEKYSRGISLDEFGDRDVLRWKKELNFYYQKKIEPLYERIFYEAEFDEIMVELEINKGSLENWLFIFKDYFAKAICRNIEYFCEGNLQSKVGNPSTIITSGIDYEIHLANRINSETSWKARITPASGDQGADIILTKGVLTAVIQSKYYSSKIGNGAVQEAFSAKEFYHADLAFVVTNSSYTASAHDLSQKTRVKLLSEDGLIELLKE